MGPLEEGGGVARKGYTTYASVEDTWRALLQIISPGWARQAADGTMKSILGQGDPSSVVFLLSKTAAVTAAVTMAVTAAFITYLAPIS